MNKLILFNEPSGRKSQQMILSRIGMIRLQLFKNSLIQMIRLERVFSELNSQVKNREISRATDAAKK